MAERGSEGLINSVVRFVFRETMRIPVAPTKNNVLSGMHIPGGGGGHVLVRIARAAW